MTLEDLERRIQVLEDMEAIKRLKARYCAYCDNNYDVEGIAALFTADAVWDGGSFGRYEGREAIRAFFQGAPQLLSFAMHQVMNPVIEVQGERASGQWYIFEPVTFTDGEQAGWIAGRYEDEYVKVGGEWKYKRLRFFPLFSTPFDQGWVKNRFV